MSGLEIYLLAILFFLLIIFSPSTVRAAIVGAPFLPTPKPIIRKALKLVDLKPNEKLYDLGSGTGRVLVIASKEFGVKTVGFEYSIPLFCISKINLFIHRVKDNTLYRKDFYEADIRDADVIFLFLTPKAFKKLEDKFNKELKKGTRIVTFSSPLLFWKPKEVISSFDKEKNIKIYLYTKE